MNKTTSTLLTLSLLTSVCSVRAAEKFDFSKLDLSKLPPSATQKGVSYAKDIRPILEASCFRCHGEERPKGGLRLDSLEAVHNGGEDGKIIIPGKSKDSPLVIAAARIDDETAMPPKRGPGGPGGPGGFGGPGGPGGRGGFGPGLMLAPQRMSQADKNADKKLTKAEFTALADAWFDKLDTDKSGALDETKIRDGLNAALPRPSFGGPGGPGGGRGPGGQGGQSGTGGQAGGRGPGGQDGQGGPGGFGGGGFGPPPKPLTAEQVGLIRAWIDQGAK